MATKTFIEELTKLTNNNTSGSSELLNKLNQLLLDNFVEIQFNSALFETLYTSFQSFESILNYLRKLEDISKNDNGNIISYFKKLAKNQKNIFDQIFENFKPYLSKDISLISISNSNTVYEVVKRINNFYGVKQVVICESRPQNEGRLLAEKFSKEGKSKRKYMRIVQEADYQKYIATKYNEDIVQTVTGIDDKIELKKFMEYCKLSEEFIINSIDYKIYLAIKECYLVYANLH